MLLKRLGCPNPRDQEPYSTTTSIHSQTPFGHQKQLPKPKVESLRFQRSQPLGPHKSTSSISIYPTSSNIQQLSLFPPGRWLWTEPGRRRGGRAPGLLGPQDPQLHRRRVREVQPQDSEPRKITTNSWWFGDVNSSVEEEFVEKNSAWEC